MPDRTAIADLDRMRSMARYDLFAPGLAAELETICHRTAARIGAPYVAVHVVLDTATAVIATNGDPTGLVKAIGGIPNEMAVCPAVVQRHEPVVVDDLAADAQFADNPGVRAGLLRAYAGVPVVLPDGQILGTHCASSRAPRRFTDSDVAELRAAGLEVAAAVSRHPAVHR